MITTTEQGLGVAETFSLRANCTRRQVGAVIYSRYGTFLAGGWNGAAEGRPQCLEGACPRGRKDYDSIEPYVDYNTGPGLCIAVHAEVRALLRVYRMDELDQGVMFVTDQPCQGCYNVLYETNLAKVVWPTGDRGLS